jgi:uroporphyrinogen decarboxylase
MNKRDIMLNPLSGENPAGYVPAAFFLHFDPAYHQGQAAIDKHLEFFRYTGMDFVKIQYEQNAALPRANVQSPAGWANAPRVSEEFFEPTVRLAEGLVRAAGSEALVVLTLYSPFMWARHWGGDESLARHLEEDPQAVKKGLEIMTENVLTLARSCKQVGIDGFYASTQGGEAFRSQGNEFFRDYIKPTDLAVWDEIGSCTFNILHICDYEGGYDDLTPFLDYPGHVVNSSLKLGDRSLTPKELSKMFGRPFMGGLERKGVIAAGSPGEVRRIVEGVLAEAPERFILAADCTVPGETPWENLRTAVDSAHHR